MSDQKLQFTVDPAAKVHADVIRNYLDLMVLTPNPHTESLRVIRELVEHLTTLRMYIADHESLSAHQKFLNDERQIMYAEEAAGLAAGTLPHS